MVELVTGSNPMPSFFYADPPFMKRNAAIARCTICGLTLAWLPEKFDMIDRWNGCGERIVYVG